MVVAELHRPCWPNGFHLLVGRELTTGRGGLETADCGTARPGQRTGLAFLLPVS